MTTRERIDIMIEKAKNQRIKDQSRQEGASHAYWNGYISALNKLKLSVKTKE